MGWCGDSIVWHRLGMALLCGYGMGWIWVGHGSDMGVVWVWYEVDIEWAWCEGGLCVWCDMMQAWCKCRHGVSVGVSVWCGRDVGMV